MARTIVITSGKGGVGKTTSTANIGTALALLDQRVCLIDLDIGLRNLDVIMGLESRIIYDIIDVVEERVTVDQALIKDKRFDDQLYLLPAAQNAEKSDISEDQMQTLVESLSEDFDFILIDCPAGIEQGFRNAISAADEAILVTTPEISAIRDVDRVTGIIENTDVDALGLIINRVRPSMQENESVMSVDEITRTLAMNLLGVIYEDDEVVISSNEGNPIALHPDNIAAKGFRNVARRLLGESVPLTQIEKKKEGFWQRFKRFFSRNKS